jgi:uncharacterized protein
LAGWRLSEADLPKQIALFPLAGALLLPRGRLPLHIFEPRYLEMVDDALKTRERIIGMIQPQGEGLHRIGCAGRITSFAETEDGRYLITLTGISRFRLGLAARDHTPYLRGQVSFTQFQRDLGPAETDPHLRRDAFLENLGRFLESRELSTDWSSLKDAEDEMLINALSMLLPFEPEERQALLEAPGLSERRETLVTLMEFALHGGSGEDPIQ